QDHSSERERYEPNARSQSGKRDRIRIDRDEVLAVDSERLPLDAVFKGYEDVVVQDVIFRTANVVFHKEKLYSPSQHQTFLASLPPGSHGQCGPGIKSLVLALYCGAQMSAPQVAELLNNVARAISAGQVSNAAIQDHVGLHAADATHYQA